MLPDEPKTGPACDVMQIGRHIVGVPREDNHQEAAIRVWCTECRRSIDSHPLSNTYAPCPYCGSELAKTGKDPMPLWEFSNPDWAIELANRTAAALFHNSTDYLGGDPK